MELEAAGWRGGGTTAGDLGHQHLQHSDIEIGNTNKWLILYDYMVT